MAYTFFPTTAHEITTKCKAFPGENIAEMILLRERLSNKYGIDAPINIDLQKRSNVNVSRALENDTTIINIKKLANIEKLTLKFGNGSSGNRGINNRGNLFEPEFADDMLKWWAGDKVSRTNNLKAIEHLNKVYNLRKSSSLTVDVMGKANTPRPIDFTGANIVLTNTKGTGTDVGESVTDVTLHTDDGPIYLSLKLGATTTFFNVGVRKILTPDEVESGVITNRKGLRLLSLFGIDPTKFCLVFKGGKGTPPSYTGIETVSFNKPKMKKLLESGIGHNYHIIHKNKGQVLSKQMDKATMVKSANIRSVKLYYGGKTGTGRRINMEMSSSVYKFSLNIRDTQGRDGYPTRTMCDFKTL